MKKLLLICIALFCFGTVFGQLTGSYTIPGNYPSIDSAFYDINTQGVGGSGVTFNVAAGYTEIISDSLILTASGKVSGALIFQKDPSTTGANPLLTRSDAGFKTTSTLGGQGDAVIILQGCDYVTFDGIDVSASDEGIEYGYYLRKIDGGDGCKNVTIKNLAITMTKGASQYVAGIYSSNNTSTSLVSSATGILLTGTGGRNEDVTITGNTISNVFTGILLRGYNHTSAPYEFYDQNFVIGSSGAGNIIRNFAGNVASASYGVYLIYHANPTISYNTISNFADGGSDATSTLYGIFMSTSSAGGNFTANNNTITLGQGATSGAHGIYVGQPCTSITLTGNSIGYGTFASTTISYMLYASSATNLVTVTSNYSAGTITKTSASGAFYGYYNSGAPTGGTETIANNDFSNISVSGSSAFYGIYSSPSATQNKEIYNNIVSSVTTGTGAFYGINSLEGLTSNIYSNSIHTVNTGGTIYGIYSGGTASVTHNTYANSIHDLHTTGASSALYGIYASIAITNNLYRNNIYDLSIEGSGGTISGIYGISGTNLQFFNNYISDLKAPYATGTNSVMGINIGGGTNASLLYNTIFLNAESGGATFGSSGVYASTSVALDMRNNIIVNQSNRAGNTGFTVAYRRSTATLTSYASSSNTNDFFVPASSGICYYLFYDGTNKDSVMADYKTRVAPRDAGSFSEDPPFINKTTAPFNLHLQLVNTKCESGGTPVSTPIAVNNDFDEQPRFPNPGYPENITYPATAPDVGADEFAGQPILPAKLRFRAIRYQRPMACVLASR